MTDLERNRIVLRLLFIVSIGLLVPAPAARVIKIEIYNKYYVPADTACVNSHVNPLKMGCAGPCTEMYRGEKARYGERGDYAINSTCAKTCQHTLEMKMRECISALKAGGTETTGTAAGYGSSQQSVPPIAASFTATPVSGIAQLTVTFTDTYQGNAVSRLWNFGDGTSGNNNVMTHDYRTPASVRVSLPITSFTREARIAYRTITVNFGPLLNPEPEPVKPVVPLGTPDATIDASSDSGPAPLVAGFTGRSTGSIANRTWELERGLSHSKKSPLLSGGG